MTFGEITRLIIAFAIGVAATFLGFLLQEFVKGRQLRRAIARAMLAEATAARQFYMDLFGTHLEQTPETQLPVRRARFREYQSFPIFDSLVGSLGLFPKEDAAILAKVYTEGNGFVQTLRNFFLELDRYDYLNMEINKAKVSGVGEAVKVLSVEHTTLESGLLQFWVEVRRRHRVVTDDLFEEFRAILEKHSQPTLLERLWS